MANIALVTNTAVAGTRRTTFTDLGHTVDQFTTASATQQILAAYDLVVAVDASAGAASGVVAAFDSGTPLLCCNLGFSTAGFSALGLSQSTFVNYGVSSNFSRIDPIEDFENILHDAAIRVNEPFDFATAAVSGNVLPTANVLAPSAHRMVLDARSTPYGALLAVADKGGLNTQGQPFPARIAFLGNFGMPATASYTDTGVALVDSLVKWLTGARETKTVFVQSAGGAPLARRVYAHRRADGLVLSRAISDPDTGRAVLTGLSKEQECYFVCLDEEGGDKAALIFDRVLPD